jgi:hypothetical protein
MKLNHHLYHSQQKTEVTKLLLKTKHYSKQSIKRLGQSCLFLYYLDNHSNLLIKNPRKLLIYKGYLYLKVVSKGFKPPTF